MKQDVIMKLVEDICRLHHCLEQNEDLQSERQRAMEENIPTPKDLFGFVVNGVDTPLIQSLQFMIHKTAQLQSLI